jgi:hypothetical protein
VAWRQKSGDAAASQKSINAAAPPITQPSWHGLPTIVAVERDPPTPLLLLHPVEPRTPIPSNLAASSRSRKGQRQTELGQWKRKKATRRRGNGEALPRSSNDPTTNLVDGYAGQGQTMPSTSGLSPNRLLERQDTYNQLLFQDTSKLLDTPPRFLAGRHYSNTFAGIFVLARPLGLPAERSNTLIAPPRPGLEKRGFAPPRTTKDLFLFPPSRRKHTQTHTIYPTSFVALPLDSPLSQGPLGPATPSHVSTRCLQGDLPTLLRDLHMGRAQPRAQLSRG